MLRVHIILLLVVSASLASITSSLYAQVPQGVYRQVIADLNQKKYAEAAASLKAALKEHPQDARALGLMAVILDAQKRYADAEGFYQRAIKLSPRSSSLFNNLGNHYLTQDKAELARRAYLRVIQIDPYNRNANLQLAQICIVSKQGREALRYLTQLPREDKAAPGVELLRARALRQAGDSSGAARQLTEALKQSKGDPRVAFSAGLLFAEWKRFAEAEGAFSKALLAEPTNFDILYNLGLSALGAHELAQAEEAFTNALKLHPEDVDSLLGLAQVDDARDEDSRALTLLYRAERLAPDRPDVLRLMARIAQKIGLYRDSIRAYNKLLQLQPDNQIAHRNRGFVLAQAKEFTEATAELSFYVKRNPHDPIGLYDLALAESLQHKALAVEHLSQALALDPEMSSARLLQATLLRQQGKFAKAIHDLKVVLQSEPENVPALGELGETYLSAGRTQHALGVLQKASWLAPGNSLVLLRYGRALMRAGEPQRAQAVLVRFRKIAANEHRHSLVDATSVFPMPGSPESSGSNVKVLERLAAANPADVHLKVELGKALLSSGKTAEALAIFRLVKSSTQDSGELDECGRALLETGQFKAATEFLKAALAANPASVPTRLDLAIALFHNLGAQAALKELGSIPPGQRKGDYFLLRAQLLDSLGQTEEAAVALNQGFQASPTRPDLYFQAALFLIKHNQPQQVIKLLAQADRIIPYSPQLWLTRAMAFEMLRREKQALAILSQIELRSPAWYPPYEIQGIVLSIHFQPVKAKAALAMAIALGAGDPQVYFYLASATMAANTKDIDASQADRDKALDEAQIAIDKALALDSKDPYIQSVAGKIAFLKKDYPVALQHLDDAVVIWPEMVEAHETLSATYRAMGERYKSADELKAVLRIKQRSRTAEQLPPFSVRSLLFTVR